MSSEARIVRKTVEDYVYRTPPHLRDCAVLADHIVEALQASPPIPDRSPEDSTMPIRACLQWCVDHDGECLGDHQAILASAIEALNNGPSAGEPRNSVPEAREEAHQLRKELANYLPDLNGKFHLPENIVMRIKAALLSAPSSIEPTAWRYRFVNEHGIGGHWKYVEAEDACNPLPGYQREPLYTAPSATGPSTGPLKLDTERQVFFYEQDHYYLSNFSAFNVEYDGQTFATAEHAYHFQRFAQPIPGHNGSNRHAILFASSAHEAFRYAQDHKASQRPDWDGVKVDVMLSILRAKAAQHEYVRRKLLQTGERELVENSWRDPFWGWGKNRDGENMLGRLWMDVRTELRATTDGGDKTP